MLQDGTRSVVRRIENLRNLIVSIFGLVVAAISAGLPIWLPINLPGDPQGPINARLAVLHAVLSVAAALLAWRGLRVWAVRLLSVTLATIPTVLVLGLGWERELAISAYVIVLLVSGIGGTPTETLIATGFLVPLTIILFWSNAALYGGELVWFFVCVMLLATGLTLALLQLVIGTSVRRLRKEQVHFRRLSHLDPLTGLGNRRQFDISIGDALAQASPGNPVTIVLLDLDNLKQINDRIGHPAGDEALCIVADIIRSSIRQSDVATRIGGDEFVIILPQGGLGGAAQIKQRIMKRIEAAAAGKWSEAPLSVSIGAAETTDPQAGIDELVAAADVELYTQRREMRARVRPELRAQR